MAMSETSGKPFTGRHFLIGIVLFFVAIFAANGVLLYFALTSWSGLEVESSYEAGLTFNKDIATARQQTELGWTVEAEAVRAADGSASIKLSAKDKNGTFLRGLTANGRLSRPIKRSEDRAFNLTETADGLYTASIADVPAGQWDLIIEAKDGPDRIYRSRNRLFFKP